MSTIKINKGDTLTGIAKKYGTTVNELIKINGIADPNKIQAGATLNIPGGDVSQLPALNQGKTLSVSPAPTQTKELPQVTTPTSRLLSFSSALNTATDIAKKKRLEFQASVLNDGVAPGVRNASDFTGILRGVNDVDSSFVKPLVSTALDVAKSTGDDVAAIAKTAAQKGAPKSVIDAILSTDNLGDALSSAGSYIQNKEATAPTGKRLYSGALEFTPTDISEGAAKLEASKNVGPEADGQYVDPSVYLDMYKTWIANKGLPQDFTKYYPPKTYVNPKNTWLPANLRSQSGAFSEDDNSLVDDINAAFQNN